MPFWKPLASECQRQQPARPARRGVLGQHVAQDPDSAVAMAPLEQAARQTPPLG